MNSPPSPDPSPREANEGDRQQTCRHRNRERAPRSLRQRESRMRTFRSFREGGLRFKSTCRLSRSAIGDTGAEVGKSERNEGDVTPFWKIDAYWVVGAEGPIVQVQLIADPARMNSHDRIDFGVIIRRPLEHLYGDCRLFQLRRLAMPGMFDTKPKKLRGARRGCKRSGLQDALQLGIDLCVFNH